MTKNKMPMMMMMINKNDMLKYKTIKKCKKNIREINRGCRNENKGVQKERNVRFSLTFCQKTQKYSTFSKNCINTLLFQMSLVPLYLELRGTLKSDENFVLIIPLYLELRGIFIIIRTKKIHA